MKASELMKAIRAKCLDCCCGQSKEVRYCTSKNCSLHPYRPGASSKSAEPLLPLQEDPADGPADDGATAEPDGAADAQGGDLVFLRQAEKLHRACTRAKGRLKAEGASKSLNPAAAGTTC